MLTFAFVKQKYFEAAKLPSYEVFSGWVTESLSQTSWEWIPAFQALASNYWMSPMRRRGEEGWMNFQHDPEREYWPKLTLHHIFLDSPSGELLWCILTWIFIWCSQIWFLLLFSLLHPSLVQCCHRSRNCSFLRKRARKLRICSGSEGSWLTLLSRKGSKIA